MRARLGQVNRHRGFTLLEVVVTMVILSIVAVLGSKMLGRAYETYDLEKRTTNVDWQGRVGLERMVRELRGIRSSADLTLPATSEIGRASCRERV